MPGHVLPDEETPRLESRCRNPKLGPPDLGFPTAGIGMSLPCPEGEQARMMVARLHPLCLCDTLAAPCRMGSREALRTQIIFPLWFTHVLFGGRYAGLAFVQGSIALGSRSAGVSPSYPAPPSRNLSVTRTRLVRRSSFAIFESRQRRCVQAIR